jgi:hypothetical protein
MLQPNHIGAEAQPDTLLIKSPDCHASKGYVGHQFSDALEDHFSISCFSLADLGGQRIVWPLHRVSPYRERQADLPHPASSCRVGVISPAGSFPSD